MPIRIGLDQELHRMGDMLFEMEELVNTSLRRAMESLKQRDPELAQRVIAEDDAVNQIRYEIEQFCVDTIATQRPVATDCTIMASAHIAVEMERMGDHPRRRY